MAQTMLQALVARFTTSSIIAATGIVMTGQRASPWVGEAKPDTPLPYVELRHQGEVPGFFCAERVRADEGKFAWLVWQAGLEAAEAIATAIMSEFDPLAMEPRTFTITGHECYSFMRTNYVVTSDGQTNRDGNRVFSIAIPYTCKFRRTY